MAGGPSSGAAGLDLPGDGNLPGEETARADLDAAPRRRLTNRWGWALGLALWALEIVVVGYLAFVVGALSPMATAGCMPDSAARYCSAWMWLAVAGPIVTVALTVLVCAALMVWKRTAPALIVSLVATPLVTVLATLLFSKFVLGDLGIRFG